MDNKWLQIPKDNTTNQNSKVVMNGADVNTLINWLLDPPFSSLIFGDYTKWCANLLYYPTRVPQKFASGTSHILQVAGQVKRGSKKTTCRGLLSSFDKMGYTLGEFKVDKFSSFMQYEPYTKYQLWLPYYGLIDLKSTLIEDKYVQIRLYVDYSTGKAQYVIGVNDNSVPTPYAPFLSNTIDDKGTRIIATYNFQLGYEIPLGSSGMSDMLRNMAISGVIGVAQLVASAYGSIKGYDSTTTYTQEVRTKRNTQTGRQVKAGVKTKTAVTDYSGLAKERRMSTAIQTAGEVLSAFHLTPSVDRIENSVVNSATCQYAVFIIKKPILSEDIYSAEFRHLNGSPLCKITSLQDITGYTELTDIHLTGDGFAQITDKEKAMLDSELSNGIIL